MPSGRPRRQSITGPEAPVYLLLILCAASCSGLAEQQILDKYFAACRVRDLIVLRTGATFVFEPLRDGMVQRLRVVGVEHQPSRSITIGRSLPLGHLGAASIRPDPFDAALPADWRLAALSAFDGLHDFDLSGRSGHIAAKDVTVEALVLPPQGSARPETLRVRMERVELAGQEEPRTGRWVITGVVPRP